MKRLHGIQETRLEIDRARIEGKVVGFCPTMGALHDGHLALVRRAKEECGFVAVSIFVNPTQFAPTEDFDKYPRTLESDTEKLGEAGVDLVFAPSAGEMYPKGFDSWIEVGGPAETLEAKRRPGHFRGVTTVCAKLFNITDADYAYFGMKDYQQLKVIEKMIRELNLRVRIVPVETIREPDGLAMSSRNAYLSAHERRAALVLSRSLREAEKKFDSGERNPATIQYLATNLIKAEPLAEIDYVTVVDAETLQPTEIIADPAVILLAVRIGNTRLIDNAVLDPLTIKP